MDAPDRVLRTLSAGNRVLLRAVQEQQLLEQMCRVIHQDGGYRFAWVGYAQQDEAKSVRLMASAGAPGAKLVRQFSWDEKQPVWTTVTRTIRSGKPCIGRNLITDPDLPESWREDNRAQGFAGVSSFPLTQNGDILGNLSIYSDDPEAFTESEVELLAQLADDLSFGIRNLRIRAEHDRAQAELLRVDRARRTVSAGNRTLLRAKDEESLLADMVRAVVEVGGYRVAWVGYAQQDEKKTILPMAVAGEDQGFFKVAHLSWADDAYGKSASSTAVRTGKPCIGRNLLTETQPAPWHAEAIERGFAAVSSFPLVVEQKVIGCMSIIAHETDAFGAAEAEVLAEMAEDLAFGIAALRMRAAHREAEQTIQQLAFYDRLTGLPNRQRFATRIAQNIEAARARNRSFGVLMLGVDHFREVNETLGYSAGDHLLRKIAERLLQEVAEEEAVARCGEAEFGVLLARADAESAMRMARKLSLMLYEPVEMDGLMLDARASIGVALYPGQGTEAELLIRRATIAMQPSRRAGGAPTIYAGGLDRQGESRLSLMGDLHRAIQNDELLLYCQPKVRMATERICGAEALVRWNHPRLGMISASDFISLAEQGGLINPLTDWVMHAAFRETYAWRGAGLEVPLAVNLSTRDLRDPHLPERIRGLIATWGAEPDWVHFELTESALMQDPQGCLERLTQLKDIGTELYIDDFGTGYSSLSYLQRLPVDAIKIDKSFVEDMLTDHASDVIVRSTIELAHNLDLQVVAEGVENRDFWARLAQNGCDVAQGYEISKPIPADDFKSWQAQSPWKL